MSEPREKGSGGIPLGRIAGVPIILAWSWFFIAGFIVVVFGPQLALANPGLGALAYVLAFGYALLLAVSVLVHELAHALLARVYGWPTARIELTLWGGHTQFGNLTATPGPSLLVALAGPAANLLLAGLGMLILPLFHPTSISAGLADVFIWTNFLVALFNVLPGLPLDGGRIVESAVWKATGSQEKGTVAAGWAGRIIAVLLVAVTLGLPLIRGAQPGLQLTLITVLVAGFLWVGAGSAIGAAQMRLRLPYISAESLETPAISIVAGSSVAQARDLLAAATQPSAVVPALVVVGPTGRPEAVVDSGAMAAVPSERAAFTPVNAVARALAPGAYVPRDATGQELVQYLAQLSGTEYAVMDRTGRITGLLYQSTVIAAIRGRSGRPVSR